MSPLLNINYQQLTDLISEAKTEQAFDILQKALQGQVDYGTYFKEVVLLSNNYSQLERAKRIDIVGFQDYTTKSNQITNALLELIEDLEEGKAHQPTKISLIGFWNILAILGFLAAVVIGGIGTIAYFSLIDKEEEQGAVIWKCPVYNTPAFKVLVLPFNKDISENRTPPHLHIASRLDEFSRSKQLQVHIGTIQSEQEIEPAYSQQEAQRYADKCNPDMLVWGNADMVGNKTGLVMHYSLTNPAQFDWLSEFETTGKIDTILTDALTTKTYEGATREIEQVLQKIIEATVAYKNEEYAKVISITETLPKGITILEGGEKNADFDWQYMRAKSFRKIDQPAKAIDIYSEILEKDPTAALALNNRGYLQLQQKEYSKALADFNTLETLDKANYEVIYRKAEIHEQLGDLGAAKAGLKKAQAACPPSAKKTINAHIQQVEKKIKIKEDKISKANRATPATRSSDVVDPSPRTPRTANTQAAKTAARTKALLIEAAQQNTIGNTAIAEEKIIEVLKKQPNNKKALKELIRSKYFEDNTISLSDLQKNPYLRNINATTLKKLNDPILDIVLRNERVKGER